MSNEDPFEQMVRVVNANADTADKLGKAAISISNGANNVAEASRKAVQRVEAAVAGLTPESVHKALSEALTGVKRDAGSISQAAKRLEDAASTMNRAGWEGMWRLILQGVTVISALAALVLLYHWWETPKIENHYFGCAQVTGSIRHGQFYKKCVELTGNPNTSN